MLLYHVISIASALASRVTGLVTKDGSGRLPAMGWSSWNVYQCDIDEDKVLTAAHKLQDLGLQNAGYEYVNIDDCWAVKGHRDPNTSRMIPNHERFPRGIDGLARELHRMGFKAGIYSDAGTKTCSGYPGSLFYEDIDAAAWAEWEVDYLKYDNCNVPSSWPGDAYHNCHPDFNNPKGDNATCINDPCLAPADYDWSSSSTTKRFNRMRDALAAQNRTIVYSLCEWGQAAVEKWGHQSAQSWRVTDDIFPYWAKIKHIINYNSFLLDAVNFFGHNDADMLEVGNGNLTFHESRTHFALWAAMKSPLLIGTDLVSLDPAYVTILKNPFLISFNQDPTVGEPAKPFLWDWSYSDQKPPEFWEGSYGNGDVLVLMVNYSDEPQRKIVDFGQIPGIQGCSVYRVTEVWSGKSEGRKGYKQGKLKAIVQPHDTAAFVVEVFPA